MTRASTQNGEDSFTVEETEPGTRSAVNVLASGLGMEPTDDGRSHADEVVDRLIIRLGGTGGGGGRGPKSKILDKLTTAALVLLLGSGGILASYYATRETVKSNTATIEKHGDRSEQHRQLIDANTAAVGQIKSSVDALGVKIDIQTEEHSKVKRGIDELKQERVQELKQKLQRAERDLIRERRRNR